MHAASLSCRQALSKCASCVVVSAPHVQFPTANAHRPAACNLSGRLSPSLSSCFVSQSIGSVLDSMRCDNMWRQHSLLATALLAMSRAGWPMASGPWPRFGVAAAAAGAVASPKPAGNAASRQPPASLIVSHTLLTHHTNRNELHAFPTCIARDRSSAQTRVAGDRKRKNEKLPVVCMAENWTWRANKAAPRLEVGGSAGAELTPQKQLGPSCVCCMAGARRLTERDKEEESRDM